LVGKVMTVFGCWVSSRVVVSGEDGAVSVLPALSVATE
jgi:hypothetical protein